MRLILLPVAALLALSACAPTGSGGDWQDVSYNASKVSVGIMGPSGPIGP
jgi:hypothetical protein